MRLWRVATRHTNSHQIEKVRTSEKEKGTMSSRWWIGMFLPTEQTLVAHDLSSLLMSVNGDAHIQSGKEEEEECVRMCGGVQNKSQLTQSGDKIKYAKIFKINLETSSLPQWDILVSYICNELDYYDYKDRHLFKYWFEIGAVKAISNARSWHLANKKQTTHSLCHLFCCWYSKSTTTYKLGFGARHCPKKRPRFKRSVAIRRRDLLAPSWTLKKQKVVGSTVINMFNRPMGLLVD